jgi:tRNA pseudouridine55 synthase
VLAERPVTVSVFEVLGVRQGDWIDVDVRVDCSSGTYVRALARDLGAGLGVGGHLTALRRTRIGPFGVEEAGETLLAPAAVAARLFPTAELDAQAALDLGNGKRIALDGDGGPIAAIAPDGRLVGLVQAEAGRARVLVNFPADGVSE